jgi:D-alanyl-D-alanine carboxypeptidase
MHRLGQASAMRFRAHVPSSRPAIARRLLVALTIAVSALAAGAPVSPVGAVSPLPACRYADVPTKYPWYSTWQRTLLDPIYKLPSTYAPKDLRNTSLAGLNSGSYVRYFVIADLKAMAAAARAAGARFAVQSAYRSYTTQAAVFQNEVRIYGYARALKQAARAGHSEHQLGTTLDFRSYYSTQVPWTYTDWGQTAAGKWLAANSWKYGFVMSYPKDKTDVTCYTYEPWHFRYFGRAWAKIIHDSRMTVREFLWYRAGNGS